ncbi:recombinase family protein [Rhodopseudomonas palustris]|uniref:Resolvase-like n=1 Tax=Rhodopseudomonas palustris (strain BisB18) TaxID=316056 RepID=Q210J5_RHOPB
MVNKFKFVAYYRVSTRKQGVSGLGIEAQRAAVVGYLKDSTANVVAEFIEIESGRRHDRPALEQALATARIHRAALVVAKVDRLTRSVGFLSKLLEAGVDVRFADLPAIEGPTGRFMLQQMAAVAELEAGLISSRTRAALSAAKARGQKLGGNRGVIMSQHAQAEGRMMQANRAKERAADLAPLLDELRRAGLTSATGLAKELTNRCIPTARGGKGWSALQVIRVIAKMRSGHLPQFHLLQEGLVRNLE